MYGIIQDNKLVIVGKSYPGAKPLVYEDVPLFDQTAHYVIQLPPVDVGDHIYMGIEIRDLEMQEGDGGEVGGEIVR